MRPRIALAIGQLHRGGAETQLVRLARGLSRRRRFEPAVVCLSEVVEPHGAALASDGIEVRVLPRAARGAIARTRALQRTFDDLEPALCHAFLFGPSLQVALATYGGRRLPYVAANRTGALRRPVLRQRLECWALRRASRVTVNSRAAADWTRRTFGVPSERIVYVPNGIDVDDRPDASVRRARVRRELGVTESAPLILGVFRVSPEKDVATFCAVAERALQAVPGSVCRVAGDGPDFARMERLVRASPVADRMGLLGPRDDVADLLAAGDLLLHTSRREGMPNSVLEALAGGVPVVATDVGGTGDLVAEGECGHLRPPGDVDGLAARCIELLGDPARREAFSRAARARVRESFSVERMVEAHETLYAELL